jgi:hypothetical protein
MNVENISKPTKPVQITIVIIVSSILLAVCVYCFYSIYAIKKTKVEQQAYQKKEIRESDGTWGVVPNEACTVYQDIGLMGLGYKVQDTKKNLFACNSPIVDIPSKTGKKTLQYQVSGYPEKATHFSLVLTIKDNLDSAESIAARKSWAIYAAVLYTKLFGQTVGEFSESQMQELVALTEKSNVSYYKDGKLLITADVKVKDGKGTYTFNIDGLPNLKF